ncbi:DUF6296 family protein [Kitasatospora sp. NPDC088346]|uniref:DUF6296 family protein n=1 Tax=Kitasatospora sp. NPDC088346 TaxID=3364073 RepID=UPI0037F2A78B
MLRVPHSGAWHPSPDNGKPPGVVTGWGAGRPGTRVPGRPLPCRRSNDRPPIGGLCLGPLKVRASRGENARWGLGERVCTRRVRTGAVRRYLVTFPSRAGSHARQRRVVEHARGVRGVAGYEVYADADGRLRVEIIEVWCCRPQTGAGTLPHASRTSTRWASAPRS